MKSVCERSNSGIILDEFVENSYLLTLLILDCCSLNQVLKSPSVCHSFFHSFIHSSQIFLNGVILNETSPNENLKHL